MKRNKKNAGIKAEIRAAKNRERRRVTTVVLALILITVAFLAYFAYTSLNAPQDQTANRTSQLRAAIVDHLGLTCPNQTFVDNVTDILVHRGYNVDYYSAEKITVEFYRKLPMHEYDLVILRVHSALCSESPPTSFFTSELFDANRYLSELLTDQIGRVYFLPYKEGDSKYFSILPNFIKQGLNGRFKNTTVIMMGCDGLTFADMAEAFIEKGARAYIGWNGPVLPSITDQATICLVKNLVIGRETVRKAVDDAMAEMGSNRGSGGQLTYYPAEAGDRMIDYVHG